MTYPASVVRKAYDPVYGIPGTTKFLPTPADVIAWCDRETEPLRRSEDRAARLTALDADPVNEDRAWRPTLEELREHYGPNWGLTPQERARRSVSYSDEDLRRIYAKKEGAGNADAGDGFEL
jgi:hypothetical protein